MESSDLLTEGIGKGRLDRIVMGKLGIEIDLLEGIQEMTKKEKIQRVYLELEQPMEIVSLTGWMATKEDGEIEVHAHFSASTAVEDKIVTLGGHLIPGTFTSVKVVIVIGVIEDSNIRAGPRSRNQSDRRKIFCLRRCQQRMPTPYSLNRYASLYEVSMVFMYHLFLPPPFL